MNRGDHTPFSFAWLAARPRDVVEGSLGLVQLGEGCLLSLAQAFFDFAAARRGEADVFLGPMQSGQGCLLSLAQAFHGFAESRRGEADVVLGPMQSVEGAAEGAVLLFAQAPRGYSLAVAVVVPGEAQVDVMLPARARQDYLDLDYCAAADSARRWERGMEEQCLGTCGYTSAPVVNRRANTSFLSRDRVSKATDTGNSGCLRAIRNSHGTRLPPPRRPLHRPHRSDCAGVRRSIEHP